MAGWRDNIVKDSTRVVRKEIATPSGYESNADFLEEMRKRYDDGRSANEHNERAGRDDAKFLIGHGQWDPTVKARREQKNKPVLTFNRLIAFVSQVYGNRLMNETEIRVWPDKGGTKEIAAIRQGLIKSIYKNSMADLARDEALKYQATGGQGAFCLAIEYTDDDAFEQEIRIKHVSDPYSVVLDPLYTDPTGGDAEWGFVSDDVPKSTFEKRWPKASTTSFSTQWDTNAQWLFEGTVRIVSYWRMVTEGYKVLALYQDGTTHDVTDMDDFEWMPFVQARSDGTPYTRRVPKRFARMYVCAGNDILEGPYDYPISSLPIYIVPGWEMSDGDKLHRWGLVRPMKDPQRLHNYWRSTIAEELVAAPRNKWLTTAAAVQGYEAKWRQAATSDDPFLFYADGEVKPEHIPPPGIDAALINEAGTATQDLKDISNIHEANLGMPSNEVSGKAIQARQNVSDVGTFIYHDRLRLADERCAKNINELISYIYDTQRIVTIIGDDDKPALQVINDPSDPNSDVTLGKYGITVSVGPSTVTKRALAAEQMMAFVNAFGSTPQAALVMDLIAEAQDWPKSSEFARRFRMGLPPGTLPQDELSPEMQQQQAQQQQLEQAQQQLEFANAQAEIAKKEKDALEAEARAKQAEALAYKAVLDAQARMKDVDSKAEERDFDQIMKTLDQHNQIAQDDAQHELDAASLAMNFLSKAGGNNGKAGNEGN